MSVKSVFEFRDYKAYLKYVELQRPGKGRGFRADIARAANCQTAYVSQVFNGKAHFSLEQSHALNRLLIHNKEESRFFLLLVQYVRAGTPDLKTHFLVGRRPNGLLQRMGLCRDSYCSYGSVAANGGRVMRVLSIAAR